MRAYLVQFDIAWRDAAANYRAVEKLLAGRAVAPGSLVVLPETFATGFTMDPLAAESEGGPTESFLAGLARSTRSCILGGTLTRRPGGRSRNEAVAFDDTGALVARYAKRHLFSLAGEHACREPGDEVAAFAWRGFTVAPAVCYDLRFPETFREAVGRGADLYAVVANWPAARADHWAALLRARAIENQAFVVGVNRCGRDEQNEYAGGSVAFDPRGGTIALASAAPCVLECDLDPEAVAAYRREFPALHDMRP
jgi:predicted amidohydrolase